MKRFFAKIRRFFWSWGFLKFVLGTILIIILFYVEEDWRGARAWAATKAEWEAKGESFDPKTYYPPAIPDDQNLAALPVFQLEADPKSNGELLPLRLREALDETEHGGDLPSFPERDKLATAVEKAYAEVFKGKAAPVSATAQLEELYPIIVEVRSAAASRHAFRLTEDFDSHPVWNRGLALTVKQIKLSQRLTQDAFLALQENQSEIALDDIKIGFQMARGVGKNPRLVDGLVSVAIAAITRQPLDEGLAQHKWNDTQLADLQKELKQLDFLTQYQFTLQGEVIAFMLPMLDDLRMQPPSRATIGARVGELGAPLLFFGPGWAQGWWDMNKVKLVNLAFREAGCVDPKSRQVDPETNRKLLVELEKTKELPGVLAPWNILYAISGPALTNYCIKSAEIQTSIDHDQIACGLERYRMAQGKYPDNLDALVPIYINELPHDIMSGVTCHYRLKADGTFLLYSVGWNQTDEGGKVAYNQYNPKQVDHEQGDWVWMPPLITPTK